MSQKTKEKSANGGEKTPHLAPRMNGQAQGSVEQEAVLIISDDAEFARAIVARWQMEPAVPAFTLMGSDLPSGAIRAAGSVTIIGPRVHRLAAILASLETSGTSVICVNASGDMASLRTDHPRALFVRHGDGWPDVLVQLAAEILRRCQAAARLHRSEQLLSASNRHATLGKYMLEMRHGLNNCLTSVLGNAELLLLEPGTLSAEAREQLETIHTMALRMHEVLQRFSSLESEMHFAEKESHSETRDLSHVPVSAS